MYHIKEDKRAYTTAALIYKGLMDCLKEKPFDKITISDVQKASGVGRATFYRHFDRLTDVLYMRCDQCFKEVLTSYAVSFNENAPESLLLHYFIYWCANSEILEILLQINRMDIIFECHLKNSEIITHHFLSAMDTASEDYIYFMSLRTGIMVGYLTAWIKTGRRKTPGELVDMLHQHFVLGASTAVFL